MSTLFWLSDEQMARLEPFFPPSHGRPRVDDRRVLSGIIFINRDGLRWRNVPKEYGPPKTLYNRRKRWSEMAGRPNIRGTGRRCGGAVHHYDRCEQADPTRSSEPAQVPEVAPPGLEPAE